MPRDPDLNRCDQITHWATRDEVAAGAPLATLCGCEGYESEDALGLGRVCKHCRHLRINHVHDATRTAVTAT